MNDRDLDDEFARIIAGWDAEAPDPLPRRTQDPDGTSDTLGATSDTLGATEITESTETTQTTGGPDTTGAVVPPDGPAPTDTVIGDPAPQQAPPADPRGSGPAADSGGSDVLDLPIASTTAHLWRGGPPRRDDADAMLDRVGTDDPDDDHFVPPSEIDLPSAETDPMFWAIVGGLVGGPLLLLYVLFFDRDGSGWWVVTALAMIVVGFVLLVLRGGTERDPFDDGTRV